jgi:putative transcriptional regulator
MELSTPPSRPSSGERVHMTSTRRSFPSFAAIVVSALLMSQPAPIVAEPAPHVSIAGQFLVAAPSMGDPRFQRTVILMVRHDREGAFGLVVNRPFGERPLATLLDMLGEKETAAAGTVRLFAGGPVQPERGFVLHSSDYQRPDSVEINARVAMTSNRDILRDIGTGKGPMKSLVAFGYSGWGPGQLEREFGRRDWAVAPADFGLIFDEDRDKVWELAYAQRTQDL